MPPAQEIHLISDSNVVLEALKLIIPALFGTGGALIGIWLGGQIASQTARRTWEWDAKRDGYRSLFPAAQRLAYQAGSVLVAVNSGADDDVIEAEREKFRTAFAALNGAAVVARVTASPDGKVAINELIRYLRNDINPFLHERTDPLAWRTELQPTLDRKLEELEAAATDDLEHDPLSEPRKRGVGGGLRRK